MTEPTWCRVTGACAWCPTGSRHLPRSGTVHESASALPPRSPGGGGSSAIRTSRGRATGTAGESGPPATLSQPRAGDPPELPSPNELTAPWRHAKVVLPERQVAAGAPARVGNPMRGGRSAPEPPGSTSAPTPLLGCVPASLLENGTEIAKNQCGRSCWPPGLRPGGERKLAKINALNDGQHNIRPRCQSAEGVSAPNVGSPI